MENLIKGVELVAIYLYSNAFVLFEFSLAYFFSTRFLLAKPNFRSQMFAVSKIMVCGNPIQSLNLGDSPIWS